MLPDREADAVMAWLHRLPRAKHPGGPPSPGYGRDMTRQMGHRLRIAAAALGVTLLLGACANTPEPSTTEETAVESTTPEQSESETEAAQTPATDPETETGELTQAPPPPEPTMDPAAQAQSQDGAIAFASYAMQVYSYMYLSGDTQAWAALSSQDCQFCETAQTQAGDLYNSGGWLHIPEPPFIAVANLTVAEPEAADSPWIATMEVTENDSQWYRTDSDVSTHGGEVHPEWALAMVYQGDQWVIVAADPDGAVG